jgi:hypothetical protein
VQAALMQNLLLYDDRSAYEQLTRISAAVDQVLQRLGSTRWKTESIRA